MTFEQFLVAVSKIENIPLPGQESQFKMSPPFREQLIERYKEKMISAKQAGVMALFYPNVSQTTCLALILRNTYKGVHSAQIGFPGGKLEPNDRDLKMTALRETYEEIGVPEAEVEVIKEMTQVYIPPSNFTVQPYMGIARNTPSFIKQDDEVDAIIEVCLQDLIDDQSVINTSVPTSLNMNVNVPAFHLNDQIVWGATAMMLSEIKDLLKGLL